MLNDFYNLKSNLKSVIFTIVLLSIYPATRIMQKDFNSVLLVFMMFVISFLVNSYILNTCFYDDNSGFTKYLKAMPIKIKDYVAAKFYLLGASNFIVILSSSLIAYVKYQSVELTFFVCFLLSFLLAINLINLTFTMKMGYDKFSIYVTSIFIIGYLILFFASQKIGDDILNKIISSVNILYLLIIITFDIVLILILKNTSIKFFKERIE